MRPSAPSTEVKARRRERCYFLFPVRHWSKNSSMDGALVVSEGNASVTLNNIQVTDEGAYICYVTIGPYHGQQVVNLQVVREFHPNVTSLP